MRYEAKQINPIIGLDYPDPDVIRVGDTYYLISTTMHFMPGAEILRSYDLVNWEHASYVYDSLDHTPGQTLTGRDNIYGQGMWAASLRWHKGNFYVCFVANDTGKTYLYTAPSVEGPWKKQLIQGFYHDCSLLFDDDDRIYLAYGNRDIRLIQLKEDLSGPKENGLNRIAVSDRGNPYLGYEGTHFYKINGKYYLFLIHSLRERWMRVEACFVSDSLEGEFRGGDVLNDDRGRTGDGVAQGGIVDTPQGDWYAVLFQDYGAVGRIPILLPVTWKGEMPVFGSEGKVPDEFEAAAARPEYVYAPLTADDDFTGGYDAVCCRDGRRTVDAAYDSFGFRSCWQFNHEPDLSLIERDRRNGRVIVTTGKLCESVLQARNMLTQRMKFPRCSAEITVDGSRLKEGDYAGLCALSGGYGFAALTKRGGRLWIVMRSRDGKDGSPDPQGSHPAEEKEQEAVLIERSVARFRAEADFAEGKDEIQFFYESGDGFRPVGTAHKLYFRLDHFTGCRFGLFVYAGLETGGSASFEDFRIKE